MQTQKQIQAEKRSIIVLLFHRFFQSVLQFNATNSTISFTLY